MSMAHDCRSTLCETPHYDNDGHPELCLCEICHPEHDWQAWETFPPCEGCLAAMSQWIHENTNFDGCLFPELCTYRRECQEAA